MTPQQTHRLVTAATVLAVGYMLYKEPPAPDPVLPPGRVDRARAPSLLSSGFVGSDKAVRLGAFYEQFAEVVERDAGRVLTSLGQFRTAHTRALRLAFRDTDVAGGIKVGSDVDTILADVLGGDLTDRALDESTREKLVTGLRTIAQICRGTNDDEKETDKG